MDEKCFWCDGTGKEKMPIDKEKFDKEFDRLDAMGVFTMGECRDRALEYAGYDEHVCPHCNGTGEKTEK